MRRSCCSVSCSIICILRNYIYHNPAHILPLHPPHPVLSYPILTSRTKKGNINSAILMLTFNQNMIYPFPPSCPILTCPIISSPILSYLILSFPILSHPILCSPILSCPILLSGSNRGGSSSAASASAMDNFGYLRRYEDDDRDKRKLNGGEVEIKWIVFCLHFIFYRFQHASLYTIIRYLLLELCLLYDIILYMSITIVDE